MLLLPLSVYRLEFVALDAVRLPVYAGSAWRGAFGHALKRLVCVTREPACPPCLLYRSCVYPYLFETPPDPAAGKLRKYPAAPHPYLLRPGPGGVHPAGATVHVDASRRAVCPIFTLCVSFHTRFPKRMIKTDVATINPHSE